MKSSSSRIAEYLEVAKKFRDHFVNLTVSGTKPGTAFALDRAALLDPENADIFWACKDYLSPLPENIGTVFVSDLQVRIQKKFKLKDGVPLGILLLAAFESGFDIDHERQKCASGSSDILAVCRPPKARFDVGH
jgi:hypothetical protein